MNESTMNRRQVLKNLSLLGAGAALSSCVGPAPMGGRKVTFANDAIRQYTEEIALDE